MSRLLNKLAKSVLNLSDIFEKTTFENFYKIANDSEKPNPPRRRIVDQSGSREVTKPVAVAQNPTLSTEEVIKRIEFVERKNRENSPFSSAEKRRYKVFLEMAEGERSALLQHLKKEKEDKERLEKERAETDLIIDKERKVEERIKRQEELRQKRKEERTQLTPFTTDLLKARFQGQINEVADALRETNIQEFEQKKEICSPILIYYANYWKSNQNKIDLYSPNGEGDERKVGNVQQGLNSLRDFLDCIYKVQQICQFLSNNPKEKGIKNLINVIIEFNSEITEYEDSLRYIQLTKIIDIFNNQIARLYRIQITRRNEEELLRRAREQGFNVELNDSLENSLQGIDYFAAGQSGEMEKEEIKSAKDEIESIIQETETEGEDSAFNQALSEEDREINAGEGNIQSYLGGSGEGAGKLTGAQIQTFVLTFKERTGRIVQRNEQRINERQIEINGLIKDLQNLKASGASEEKINKLQKEISFQQKGLSILVDKAGKVNEIRERISGMYDAYLAAYEQEKQNINSSNIEGNQKLSELENKTENLGKMIRSISNHYNNLLATARYQIFISEYRAEKKVNLLSARVAEINNYFSENIKRALDQDSIQTLRDFFIEIKTKPSIYTGKSASIFKKNFPLFIQYLNQKDDGSSKWIVDLSKKLESNFEKSEIYSEIYSDFEKSEISSEDITRMTSQQVAKKLYNAIGANIFEFISLKRTIEGERNSRREITNRTSEVNDAARTMMDQFNKLVIQGSKSSNDEIEEIEAIIRNYLSSSRSEYLKKKYTGELTESLRKIEESRITGNPIIGNIFDQFYSLVKELNERNAYQAEAARTGVRSMALGIMQVGSKPEAIDKIVNFINEKFKEKLDIIKRELFLEMYLSSQECEDVLKQLKFNDEKITNFRKQREYGVLYSGAEVHKMHYEAMNSLLVSRLILAASDIEFFQYAKFDQKNGKGTPRRQYSAIIDMVSKFAKEDRDLLYSLIPPGPTGSPYHGKFEEAIMYGKLSSASTEIKNALDQIKRGGNPQDLVTDTRIDRGVEDIKNVIDSREFREMPINAMKTCAQDVVKAYNVIKEKGIDAPAEESLFESRKRAVDKKIQQEPIMGLRSTRPKEEPVPATLEAVPEEATPITKKEFEPPHIQRTALWQFLKWISDGLSNNAKRPQLIKLIERIFNERSTMEDSFPFVKRDRDSYIEEARKQGLEENAWVEEFEDLKEIFYEQLSSICSKAGIEINKG